MINALIGPWEGYILTTTTIIMFGGLFHLTVDALLVSAFLAGIRRTTGLTYVLASYLVHNTHLDMAAPHSRKYPTRTFAVSSISDCKRPSDHPTELLRTYLEFGASCIPPSILVLTESRRIYIRLCRSHLWGTTYHLSCVGLPC